MRIGSERDEDGMNSKLQMVVMVLFSLFVSEALQNSSAQAAEKREKERLAVLDLEAKHGIEKSLAEALSVNVLDKLHSFGEYQVMSKGDIQAVASREQLLQAMGCDDGGSQCLVDFGRAIGTRFMVAGDISKIGSTYTISLRMLDTKAESAGIIKRVSEKCKCDQDALIGIVEDVAVKLLGKPTADAVKKAEEVKKLAEEKKKTEDEIAAQEKRKVEAEKTKRLVEDKKKVEETEQKRVAEEKRRADEIVKKSEAESARRSIEEKKKVSESEREKIAEELRETDELEKQRQDEIAMKQQTLLEKQYQLAIYKRIHEFYILPKRLRNANLSATVVISIEANGEIRNMVFESTSGDKVFDQFVSKAIEAANPLPSHPPAMKKEIYEIGLTFTQ